MAIKDDEFNRLLSQTRVSKARPVIKPKVKGTGQTAPQTTGEESSSDEKVEPKLSQEISRNPVGSIPVSIETETPAKTDIRLESILMAPVGSPLDQKEPLSPDILNFNPEHSSDLVQEKLSQTRAKVEPNSSQIEAKVEPKLESKLSQQTQQLEPSEAPALKVEPKVEPQLKPKRKPVLSQTRAKVEPKPEANGGLQSLVGLQRQMLLFIYETCRGLGSKVSPPISIQNAATVTETTVAAARKAIQRLEEKGFIVRDQFKNGRGGWTCYKLPDSIYSQLLMNETRAKVEPNVSQTRAKVEPQPEPEVEPTPSSSSSVFSNSSNKTNTTTASTEIPDEWKVVSWESIASIGFGKPQLRQIISLGQLNPSRLQRSIDALAFDISKNGKKFQTGPLNAFMGILRKGLDYAPPENFIDPEEALLKEHLERVRQANEKKAALMYHLKEETFTLWFSELTAEDRLKLPAPKVPLQPGSEPDRAILRAYWEENIWPSELAKIHATPVPQINL